MNKFLKTALAILPLAVMASCSDDPMPNQNEGIAEESETRYLRVVISDAQGTPVSRAADLDADINNSYENGSKEENKIRTLDFYFYDRFKQFHSHYSLAIDNNADDIDKDGALDPDLPSTENNVYGIYHCNVPVELIQGETLPNYVLCIVNAVQPNYYLNKSLEDAQKTVLSTIYGSDHGKDPINSPKDYFGMSNSVYYGKDEVTGEENALIMATPFDSNKLTTKGELEKLSKGLESNDEATRVKAEEDLKDYTVNIYVERYAVKVNLNINEEGIQDYEAVGMAAGNNAETTIIKLTFEPKKWGVNAVERNFFFLKAFRKRSASIIPEAQADEPAADLGYANDFETFAEMNNLLFKGWNNPTAHRCYWARTPGYYKNSYPLVADEVVYDEDNPTGTYSVEYFSYDGLFDFPANSYKVTTYTKETTMMKDRLTGGGYMESQYLPLSSIPSVLVAGQYSINGAYVDFYIYGKAKDKHRIFSGENEKMAIAGTRKILDKMLDDQSILMVLNPTTNEYETLNSSNISFANEEEAPARNMFIVEHPSEAVRKTQTTAIAGESSTDRLRLSSDVVVLQIKEATDKFRFYNPVAGTDGEYQAVTAANINLVNRLLLQNLGGAHYYKNGMAFFSAPIQHWGWYRKDNANRFVKVKNEEDQLVETDDPLPIDQWDWTKMMTGDFGLVRNHIYTMQIGTITGLGTGITDPEEPILPPADKVTYAVHFHVNIQKWAVLPTQNWNF